MLHAPRDELDPPPAKRATNEGVDLDAYMTNLSAESIRNIDFIDGRAPVCSRKCPPESVELQIGDRKIRCALSGVGASRCVWSIGTLFVFKYEYHCPTDHPSNSADVRYAKKHPDWVCRATMTQKGSLIAEAAQYTVDHLAEDMGADEVRPEVSALLRSFMEWMIRLIEYAGVSMFRLHDLNPGNFGYDRVRKSWVIIDAGCCKDAGGEVLKQAMWAKVSSSLSLGRFTATGGAPERLCAFKKRSWYATWRLATPCSLTKR